MRFLAVVLIILGASVALALPCPETLSCPAKTSLERTATGLQCVAEQRSVSTNGTVLHGPSAVCSQGILIEALHYRRGKLHGEQEYYGYGPKLVRRERYVDGKPKGLWERWYPGSDEKESEIEFEGKVRHGLYRRFHRSGKVAEQGMVNHGVVVGAVVQYHYDGAISSLVGHVNGLRDGESISWHANGRIHSRAQFVAGIASGHYVEFTDDGRLVRRGVFENNQRHGPWTEADGAARWSGSYVRNIKHGAWTKTDENGEILELVTYSHGVFDGPFAKHGETTERGFWRVGIKEGVWATLDEGGEKTRDTYENGVQSEACVRKRGKLGCRAVFGWRSLVNTCTRRGEAGYGAFSKTITSQAEFDAYFSCEQAPKVDWKRFRLYTTGESNGIVGGSGVKSVKRSRGKVTVLVETSPYCAGIPPLRQEVRFDLLLLAGDEPIEEKQTWLPAPPGCHTRP